MSNLNKVFLLGRLTRDCDVRYTASGTCVINASLAVSRRVPKGEGKWEEETAWIDVTIWGKRGLSFSEYHKRGSLCFIEGRLAPEEWDDKKTGERRHKLKVVADDWQFVGDKDAVPASSSDNGSEEKF